MKRSLIIVATLVGGALILPLLAQPAEPLTGQGRGPQAYRDAGSYGQGQIGRRGQRRLQNRIVNPGQCQGNASQLGGVCPQTPGQGLRQGRGMGRGQYGSLQAGVCLSSQVRAGGRGRGAGAAALGRQGRRQGQGRGGQGRGGRTGGRGCCRRGCR